MWVALAFSGIFASAMALGAGCTRDLRRFCKCSGAGSGLHLQFRVFLQVQWRWERVALALLGVFASAISQWGHMEDAAGGYGVRRLLSAATPPLGNEERRLREWKG